MAEQKVELYYNGPNGNVNYDVARDTGGSAILETGKHYTVSRSVALRLLLTEGWQEKGGDGELTEEARKHTSPKYSTDPGGEASDLNPGSQAFVEKQQAKAQGVKKTPPPPGPDSADRPDPARQVGSQTGGGEQEKEGDK